MKQKKDKIIIAVLAVLLIAVIAVLAVSFLGRKQEDKAPQTSGGQYDVNVVLDDPASLQEKVDEMIEKAAEGQMALAMQVEASSDDGENFTCYLANAEGNSYDMYMIIYLDETQEEICRTGLIPVGGRIESFTSDVKLEAGTHTATIMYVQVEEDGETIHAQVNVGLDLKVI